MQARGQIASGACSGGLGAVPNASLLGTGLIDPQDLHGRRCEKDLTKSLHPFARFLFRADALMSKFLKLIEGFEIDFKLQGCPTVGPGDRYKYARFQPALARSFEFLPNGIEGTLAVYRQDIVRKPSKIHGVLQCGRSAVTPIARPWFSRADNLSNPALQLAAQRSSKPSPELKLRQLL